MEKQMTKMEQGEVPKLPRKPHKEENSLNHSSNPYEQLNTSIYRHAKR
jgi:hypothetical protein